MKRALFADLIFNEEGQPAREVRIGDVPHYAVPERILAMRDVVTEGMIQLLGEEDLFTRPAIEHAIENMDRVFEAEDVDVDELRTALWMTGFRATVDVHGDLVHLELPGLEGGELD
jgi:hypothetical protein